jgi:dTDP-4-amino-4,6-dideoxygalactose transaminase
VPPAVTPVSPCDVARGVADHVRGVGRAEFVATVTAFLDAESASTYTSYRRALAACLLDLAADREGDRSTVLVPAFASPDFAKAAEGVGLSVRRYDVDQDTLAMDLDAVASRRDDDVLALVAVNVLGYTSPMQAVAAFCDDRDLCLVETLGYALGSSYRGRRLGTFGDRAVLNFQQGKPIPVGGGMVVSGGATRGLTDRSRPSVDPNVGALAGYAAVEHPRLYGLYDHLADAFDGRLALGERATTHPGSTRDVTFEHPFATMSDFQGAVALRVFERRERDRRARAATARFYADRLAAVDGVGLLRPVSGLEDHQHVRFPIVLPREAERDAVRDALQAAGIGSTELYEWPVVDGDAFPVAARLQRRLLTLPTHPYVDERDRRTVVDTVRSTVGTISP